MRLSSTLGMNQGRSSGTHEFATSPDDLTPSLSFASPRCCAAAELVISAARCALGACRDPAIQEEGFGHG